MMKTIRSLMAIAIAMTTFVACSDSNDDNKYVADVTVPATVSTTEEGNILVEAGAGEFTFDIKTDGQWKVKSHSRFLHVQNTEGTGNATVTVRVENNTCEDRKEGTLAITFPGHEELNKTLIVEQKYLGDYGGNDADIIQTNNKVYAVGYGYDSSGEWASPNSVRAEIFNTHELMDIKALALNTAQVETSEYTVTGSTISEVSNKLKVKASVEGSYAGFKGEASASFDMETSEKTTYEYASTYFDIQLRRASFSKGLQELKLLYMTDDAYNAINGRRMKYKNGKKTVYRTLYPSNRQGFKDLIKAYGTHVIVEAGLGGRLRRSLQANVTEMSGSYDVKAYVKASYDGIVKAEASVDEAYKQSYKENHKKLYLTAKALGGKQELALPLGSESTFTAENYEAWKKSINLENMALINFSNVSLVPLYDLVDREATLDDEFEDGGDPFNGEDRYIALKRYMTEGEMAQDLSTYKCGTVTEFTVPSFENVKYNETLIKDIYLDGQWVGQVCNEYIPNINRDKRVTVVYPVVNNKARYNMGFYLGDGKSHKPARVSWNGTNVAVEEYDSLDFKNVTTVYLRGASVMPQLPDGTTALKAEDPRDEYLDVSDYRGGAWSYPMVKIFNNVWLREDYHSANGVKKYGKCVMDGQEITVPVEYYNYLNEIDPNSIPPGWRIANSDDFLNMKDKLSNNGFAQPITAIVNGGVTGFEVYFIIGFYSKIANYILSDGFFAKIDGYDNRFVISDQEWSNTIRLVRE
jgi:hypothetical protein